MSIIFDIIIEMGFLIKKIPGFRTGKTWKKVAASIGYFFIILFIILIFSPSPIFLSVDALESTNEKNVLISGEALENTLVYLLEDGEEIKKTTTDSEGKFSIALNNLADAKYSYLIKACKSDQQTKCESKNIFFTVDTTPPSKPTIALPNELPDTEGKEVVIKGKTEPNTLVELDTGEDKKTVKSNESGEYEFKTGLVLGTNTVKIKAKDELGNESENVAEIEFKPAKVKAGVKRVIDGDTIELNNGDKVRYIGIDAPETHNADECYGKQATDKNRELVGNRSVYLEKDVSNTDQYGRLLRYVWIDGEMVNETLIKQGFANASSYPPDVKYQNKFKEAEKEAREKGRGLWGEECQPEEIFKEEINSSVKSSTTVKQETVVQESTQTGSSCNCSKTCSQMASCDEAYFQMNQCGCSQRDGDGDGVPCESICSGGSSTTNTEAPTNIQTESTSNDSSGYTCSCSKTCGEMSSCEEAYFQLNQCGCSRRDGDNDGVPCESICN